MLYSFDTSAILNGRRDLFRPAVFPTLWSRIEGEISAGRIRSIDEVRRELSQRDDDAKRWADAQTDLYCPISRQVQVCVAQILKLHPKLVKVGGNRSGGDPFVIALAMSLNGTVVTEEHATNNLDKPKIPDVCADLKVPCLNLMEYIETQGWSF